MCDSEQLRLELKNFLQFASEKKSLNGDLVINSAIDLLQRVPPARSAVLMFFGQLFDDLVEKYLVENNRIPGSKNESDYLWWTLLHPSETSKPVTKERKSCDSQCAVGDTPMSPPVMETGTANLQSLPDSSDSNDDGQAINRYVDLIGKTLVNLVESDESNCRQMIIDWCLQFISGLSAKCPIQSLTSTPAAVSPVAVFSEYIRFWIKCHVVDLILKIIMNLSSLPSNSSTGGDLSTSMDQKFTTPVMNCQTLLQRLIDFSPASDWISAHLIASIPSESDSSLFAACIQCLLESKASPSSVTNMLSYISEHNPQAIINASPFNIPFLLKLAANSRPLLNLLAIEALRQVDIPMLNDLSQTLTENLQPPVIYCILNANNSYELLQLVFKACSHRDANAIVREKAFSILNSIVSHLHELVYTTNADTSAPILEVLRTNSDHLVSSTLERSSGNLKKLQTRVIELLCLHFGLDFSSRVFHQILNTLNTNSDSISSAVVSPPSPILVNLIKYLKLSYGAHIYECFRKAVMQPTSKEPKFWANLLSLFDSDDALELDIDQLTSMFTEYIQSDILDQRIFYTLKLILCCVERDPRLVKRPKHHLCISLMSFYMKLLDIIAADDYDLDLNMQMATVCQKLMSYLSKNLEANQHILTRTLIEAELQRNNRPRSTSFERLPSHLNLFKENLEYGEISKFRKISLNPRKRVFNQAIDSHESSLRRQLLLDAVRCCVTESQAFASLLVECVTPDVMFNDKPWPDEDFLKVTIERDLHIARKFDSNPVLWDFCELIANTGNLYSCSVLIRALMAVQLCCWASATASKEKLSSTQKLVSLIASSELAPSIPFKYLPQIMESLNPWEIFCVLNDLWRYMRDNSPPSVRPNQNSLRTYMERLRIITSQKLPGPIFVKIFKGLQVSPEDEQNRAFPTEEWV